MRVSGGAQQALTPNFITHAGWCDITSMLLLSALESKGRRARLVLRWIDVPRGRDMGL